MLCLFFGMAKERGVLGNKDLVMQLIEDAMHESYSGIVVEIKARNERGHDYVVVGTVEKIDFPGRFIGVKEEQATDRVPIGDIISYRWMNDLPAHWADG